MFRSFIRDLVWIQNRGGFVGKDLAASTLRTVYKLFVSLKSEVLELLIHETDWKWQHWWQQAALEEDLNWEAPACKPFIGLDGVWKVCCLARPLWCLTRRRFVNILIISITMTSLMMIIVTSQASSHRKRIRDEGRNVLLLTHHVGKKQSMGPWGGFPGPRNRSGPKPS